MLVAAAADKLAPVRRKTSKRLAARADALRADALAGDPDAAEFYGFELPEDQPGKTDSGEAASAKTTGTPVDANAEAKLDPEIDKALKHPQVRRAIEERIGEAEKIRQGYLNGLVAALNCASEFSRSVPRSGWCRTGKPAGRARADVAAGPPAVCPR